MHWGGQIMLLKTLASWWGEDLVTGTSLKRERTGDEGFQARALDQ
jgi:hypothetical protein